MNVLEKELYHGAALTQIIEGHGFESIRKASVAFGHYEVNGERRVLVRHSAAERPRWTFAIGPQQLTLLREEASAGRDVFLCLVCAKETICLLAHDQLVQVIDLGADEPQTVRVYARTYSSIRVTGSTGELSGKVLKHDFPRRLYHG